MNAPRPAPHAHAAPLVNRAGPGHVALETTLLLHGVPAGRGPALAADLAEVVRENGASPALVGLHRGRPTVGLTDPELADLFKAPAVPKANTANLGVLIHRRSHAATTVSTTMELAAAAGVRIFATGGLGGIHRGYGTRFDVSADLAALTRFPVAVVASGVKAILDVEATREALESLGVPVVGFRTDRFPAFYLRETDARVDERFDAEADLAAYLDAELKRTRRAVLVCNPVPPEDQIPPHLWEQWFQAATDAAIADGARGRDVTPRVLAHLYSLSDGATLRANIALVRSNAALAARLCRLMSNIPHPARA